MILPTKKPIDLARMNNTDDMLTSPPKAIADTTAKITRPMTSSITAAPITIVLL